MPTVTGNLMEREHPFVVGLLQQLANLSGHNIWCQSTGRTDAEQEALYQCWLARRPGCNPANPPGGASHHRYIPGQLHAVAVDASVAGYVYAQDALGGLAPRVGLHFPYDGLNGRSLERWHIEPINIPAEVGFGVPGPTYLPGMHSAEILQFQRDLNFVTAKPFTPITEDGWYGNQAVLAVKQYQHNRNLSVDGIAGPATINDLHMLVLQRLAAAASGGPHRYDGRPVLQLGSHGPDVLVLQDALVALGQNIGLTDSDFGPATQNAVKNEQRVGGLVADGVVGVQTWAWLAYLMTQFGK